jgi:hypothetical protein
METNPKKQRQHFYRDYASGQWSMSELWGRSRRLHQHWWLSGVAEPLRHTRPGWQRRGVD